MKQYYLTSFLLAIVLLPMAAQNEIAAIATSENAILEGSIISKEILSVCDTTIKAFPIELQTRSEVSSNSVQQGVSVVHLIDGSSEQDPRPNVSDGIAYLDAEEPILIDALFIYPNPTNGMVQIKLPGKLSIQIYTLEGQLVKRYQMAPGDKTLDLTALAAGIYQVRAKSDEDYFSGKLLIQ